MAIWLIFPVHHKNKDNLFEFEWPLIMARTQWHENRNALFELNSTHCASFYVEWKFLATVTGIMFQFASQEEMIIFFVDCEFSLFLQTFMQFNRKNSSRTFSFKMFLFNDMHNGVKYLWIQMCSEGTRQPNTNQPVQKSYKNYQFWWEICQIPSPFIGYLRKNILIQIEQE